MEQRPVICWDGARRRRKRSGGEKRAPNPSASQQREPGRPPPCAGLRAGAGVCARSPPLRRAGCGPRCGDRGSLVPLCRGATLREGAGCCQDLVSGSRAPSPEWLRALPVAGSLPKVRCVAALPRGPACRPPRGSGEGRPGAGGPRGARGSQPLLPGRPPPLCEPAPCRGRLRSSPFRPTAVPSALPAPHLPPRSRGRLRWV